MNNAETIHLPLPTDYYEIMRERITKLGYNDPKKDSDSRQREVWKYIEDNEIKVDIVKDFDFITNLAPREHPFYEFFQTRENCEDLKRVNFLYDQFYGEDEQKQLRIIMGWQLENFFPSLGNKRSRAHSKGQKEKELSQSKAHVLVLGAGLTEEDKKYHGFQIAEISNHETGFDPEEESTADIVSQLRTARTLEIGRDPSLSKQNTEEIKQWGKDWISSKKPAYRTADMAHVVGDMVARAFSDDRKDPIPMPEADVVADTWKQFYPDEPYDPSNTEAEVIMRTSSAAEKQSLQRLLLNRVLDREESTDARETYWLAARVGSDRKSVTSLSSVIQKRKEIIDFLTEWNTNDYYVQQCAFPKVERIMFLKQLKGDSDVAEMYVWSPVNKSFTKMEKTKDA